jgi:hypothetical protein
MPVLVVYKTESWVGDDLTLDNGIKCHYLFRISDKFKTIGIEVYIHRLPVYQDGSRRYTSCLEAVESQARPAGSIDIRIASSALSD